MFKFQGFTSKSNDAINQAILKAQALGHSYIGSEHLLLGLSLSEGSVSKTALSFRDITPSKLEHIIVRTVGKARASSLSPNALTPRCRLILENSILISKEYGARAVGTEHILLAILREKSSYAFKFLVELGADTSYLEEILLSASRQMKLDLEDSFPNKKDAQKKLSLKIPTLEKFGVDLTERAERNQLDKVFYRDKEIMSLMEILSRKKKSNPCLVGPAGVGKTAIIEGLAIKIASGDCFEELSQKRIISLDLGAMIGGTKFRGEFEDRVRAIIKEARDNSQVILFIDEIHTIVGAGGAEGAVDLSNLFKPALARGDIKLIGATTDGEYRKYIEKDPALSRRLQKIPVREPSQRETLAILRETIPSYESFHSLKISDDAIKKAVSLSERYLENRYQPDKALDLIDISASREKLRGSALVTELSVELTVKSLTGIEPGKLCFDAEMARESLSKEIFGQSEAIDRVVSGIMRGKAGISDPKKPIASFLFLGSTGTGKTSLARAIARLVFGSEKKLFIFDMSEFSEPGAVSRLIGSAPGYAGFDEEARLTECVRREPFSVVVFDEIEKCSREVSNLLLRILDEGIIEDARGERVSFRETIIILCSNLGAELVLGKNRCGFEENKQTRETKAKSDILSLVRERFSPEFAERIDETIIFSPLGREWAEKIAKKAVSSLGERLEENGIELVVSKDAIIFLGENGYSKNGGARAINRYIREKLEGEISRLILSRESYQKIVVDTHEGKLEIKGENSLARV